MKVTVIEIDNYTVLPKGKAHDWVAAATLDDAIKQVRRKITGKVYHWKNVWSFEVEQP